MIKLPAILLVVTLHSVTKPCWRTSRNLQEWKSHKAQYLTWLITMGGARCHFHGLFWLIEHDSSCCRSLVTTSPRIYRDSMVKGWKSVLMGKTQIRQPKLPGIRLLIPTKNIKKLAHELWSAIDNVAIFSYNIRDQSHHKMRNINSFKNEIISRRHLLQW